ncbi:S-layer homology domain-containing protein, partial [Paenibacillus whitsoniae]
MKKTLSVVLTSAMAFSMFTAVAFGKNSDDFTDLKDLDAATKAKFDAMISAGIFDGVSDTTFGLKDEMNRAQFAKVAALIMGLDINKDLQTSSFSDVSVSDPANGYALPYIEALKTAGVTDGYAEGMYNPAGKVTKEQLATFLVRVLGKDAEAKALTGTDATVSGWAQGYVAEALALKVLSNNEDGTFGGMSNATRDLLVTGAYEAKQQYVPAGAVSVTEAKAAGVYKVQVTFNKPVDTTKAVVALTKGTLAVSATTTWSDDKKVATLTTDTRIGEGEYTATVSGLDNVATASAKFTAQDEQVSKIDFINAGDTVAYSHNAVIKLKATNQYGEAVSLGTSNFTALVSGQAPTSFKKDDDGNLVITADVTGSGITQGNGIVPVTVYYNNSNVTVSKNFKVGTVPILSKIEAGKVTYSNNSTKLADAGDTANIAINMYDQYGNPIVKGQFDNNEILATNINPVITPYEQKLEVVKAGSSFTTADFFDDNDNARVQVKLTGKVDKTADYTVNIYGGASSATATVSVGAANLATKIEFDTSAVTLAANDTDVYVPLNVTDANGNKLSAQDIVDNANAGRFNFSVTNGTWTIQPTGTDKGKLKLHFTAANTVGAKVYVTGQISQSQANTFVQTSIPVQDARVVERITVTEEPAAKAILGASDDVVYQLKDQYGKDISAMASSIVSANGQTSNYRVKVEVTTSGSGVAATPKVAHAADSTVGNVTTYYYDNTQLADFNKGFDLTSTSGQEGKVTVKAVVEKQTNGG